MTTAYVALAGEYDVAVPLGVFDSLEKAKSCVEKSNPTYDAEVLVYNLTTGNIVQEYKYGSTYIEETGWSKIKFWKES